MRKNFDYFCSKANAHSGGAIILIREAKGITICPEWETDLNGRICSVEVFYHGALRKLFWVYAPNKVAERRSSLPLSVVMSTRHAMRYRLAVLIMCCM